jgi:hypothetical protein
VILAVLALIACKADAAKLEIVTDGKSDYSIVIPSNPSPAEKLAASELAKYLEQMSGAKIPVSKRSSKSPPRHAIVIGNVNSFPEGLPLIRGGNDDSDCFGIGIGDERLDIVGVRDRATLNAVYEFLRLLGCRWLAPKFDHYKGTAEFIPSKPTIVYEADDYFHDPQLVIRKLYVEEGHSHDAENLVELVEWMPKARYNMLVIPMNYQGRGNVMWDNWREKVGPELQKRDITIEVGGHGYQNFLNAEMEDGKLFDKHPEWFGMNDKGERLKAHGRVICTSNPEAVAYLTANFINYLKDRPEIQVFALWPPDGATWCECDKCLPMGTPANRQSILLSQVKSEVAKVRPDVRLETIAYHRTIAPPESFPMDKDTLIDICPIQQCFEYQIYDARSDVNAGYVSNIRAWHKAFDGDISIYSYYRKYAWKSLPVVFPQYIQKDLVFYRDEGVRGISSYAEPGDWFTYELNHYCLSRLAEDPKQDVNRLIGEFCEARYGPSSGAIAGVLLDLGSITRRYCSIPGTSLKSADEIAEQQGRLRQLAESVKAEIGKTKDAGISSNLNRLLLMIEFAQKDLEIQRSRASKSPVEQTKKLVLALSDWLKAHENDGVFAFHTRMEMPRLGASYGIKE